MASEYAGKDPPSDDDNEEGPNLESNTNVTKLLMTGVSRNSDEPVNESADPTSAMNALELMARTVRARYENGELTDMQQAEFMNGLECALNTAEFISDVVTNTVTPKA